MQRRTRYSSNNPASEPHVRPGQLPFANLSGEHPPIGKPAHSHLPEAERALAGKGPVHSERWQLLVRVSPAARRAALVGAVGQYITHRPR